jgi:hypothetical protein
MDGRGNVTRESATGSAVPDTTTSFGYDDAGELCWTAAGDHAPDCAAAPAGATGYGYDQAGNLTGSTDGLAAGYTLAGQTAQVTPPGGTAFTMAYAGATSDDRRQAGNLQMSSTPLGLAAQGPAATGTHSDWFVRDPDGTLVAMINRDQDAARSPPPPTTTAPSSPGTPTSRTANNSPPTPRSPTPTTTRWTAIPSGTPPATTTSTPECSSTAPATTSRTCSAGPNPTQSPATQPTP